MQNVKINNLDFEKSIFKILNKYHFIKYEKSYGVAVSGGPDSMLLLYVVNKWAKFKNKDLYVFSFNHNLRKDSSKELLLVKRFAKKLNCKFIKINWDYKPKSGIMEQARISRYSLIAERCKKYDIKTLFLGHHSDDIAETVSMRMLKKSGIEGLCPIFELKELFNIKLFRPLLKINKSQILELNIKNKIKYINDSSNLNTDFFRARIRNLLKREEKLKFNLIKASNLFCKIRNYNENYIKKEFQNFFSFKTEGYLVINRRLLELFPKFLIISFFKIAIKRIGNKAYFPKLNILNKIYLKAKKKSIFIISLGGCILKFKSKEILIFREFNDINHKFVLLKKFSLVNWDNRFEISNNTSDNYKIYPLGKILNNSFYKKAFQLEKKKIKEVPFTARNALPAIISLEGLIHIHHLNISELNLFNNRINLHTIDFFNKKYDNIY